MSGRRSSTGCILEWALYRIECKIDGLAHGVQPQVELDIVCVQLRHLHRLADETIQSRSFFFDHLHHLSRSALYPAEDRFAGW